MSRFSRNVEESAKEVKEAKKQKGRLWRYASVIGMAGWLFAIPVVAGAYLGRYLDRKLEASISWTITFIILGIALGVYNVWYFYFKEK
ncbi:MAG: AtpZ/AtpI family protein [Thermodesulfovibrionales bacterium]